MEMVSDNDPNNLMGESQLMDNHPGEYVHHSHQDMQQEIQQ